MLFLFGGIILIGAFILRPGEQTAGLLAAFGDTPLRIEALPPAKSVKAEQAQLGRLLFFDGRLSGDGGTACAACHVPQKGWSDGMALSKGYPGSLYFRNTPSVLNAVYGKYFFWDGRLPASDPATLVRDHISEAHFMQADGRLVIERLRQIPQYEEGFKKAFGGEPSYGKILNAVAAYLTTLRSANVSYDKYLQGDAAALSADALEGLKVFEGKAGCVRCHHGPMGSDGKFHNTGAPENDEIFKTPERHITFRRFFRMLGVEDYTTARRDAGRYAMTKESADRGKFRTPTLREIVRSAPYMHNGIYKTLDEVVDFYDRGGGPKNSAGLKPLHLTPDDKRRLVEFLKSLSGDEILDAPDELPQYELRALGRN